MRSREGNRRLAGRQGKKLAIVAPDHTKLVMLYHMFCETPYPPLRVPPCGINVLIIEPGRS